MLNDAAMPAFGDVASVQDYLDAQKKIITNDHKIYGRPLHRPAR
jgi:hypothetical protein